MPRSEHKSEFTAAKLAKTAGVSPATLERALRLGWCPPPTRRQARPMGGNPTRIWSADTVADFIETAREAKRRKITLEDAFKAKAQK